MAPGTSARALRHPAPSTSAPGTQHPAPGARYSARTGLRTLIVNEQAARRIFGGGDPRGTHVGFGSEYEITGVVRDARVNTLGEEAGPMVFMPYGQTRPRGSLVFGYGRRTPMPP